MVALRQGRTRTEWQEMDKGKTRDHPPTIGVNPKGLQGSRPPIIWPVLTTPQYFDKCFIFFPSAEFLNTANRCHFHLLYTIRYDTRCYFNVRSKADISQLNLPHGSLSHPSGPSGWSRSHKTDAWVCVIYWQPRSRGLVACECDTVWHAFRLYVSISRA